MPVGDCERAFQAAAASDGIVLDRARVPWLNERGHLGLPPEAGQAILSLDRIFAALDGDAEAQGAKRLRSLPGDFVHSDSGTFIEIDESQHFTTYRLRTLDLYPDSAALDFDVDEYRTLCREWAAKSDRYRQAKAAAGFGVGGRQRQRAYHDALRDLAAPVMGRPPVIRIPVPDRDGASAYARMRERMQALSG